MVAGTSDAGSDGEYHEARGDARSVSSGSAHDDDCFTLDDDFGYYHGYRNFLIRVRTPIKLPDRSSAIPGGINIYSPRSFVLRPRESFVLDLGFDLIVPVDHVAAFGSREKLVREYGVSCFDSAFGSGKTICVRSQFPSG